MADQLHSSPARLQSLRLQHPRTHIQPGEPGVCDLEDYTCLIGESFVMRSLRAQLRRASPHFRIALVIGESGTAKETVALALHRLTADSDANFVTHTAVSLVSALQDHGSSSSMVNFASRTGALAPRATLYLQNIGDLSHSEQIYLLQSLKNLASMHNSMGRPRLIFASARDLRSLSGTGHFDRNLYRMISAVEILLPPLRSRPEDIPLITCAVLNRAASSAAFDGRALSSLQCHDWPGNVRELERVVEQARKHARQHAGADAEGAALDHSDTVIEAMDLPPLGELSRTTNPCIESRVDRLDDVIQSHVLDVLLRCNGNKVRAAERLGISRSTLYRMLYASSSTCALDHIA